MGINNSFHLVCIMNGRYDFYSVAALSLGGRQFYFEEYAQNHEISTLLSQPTNRPKKQMPSIYGLTPCRKCDVMVAYYMAIQGIA